MEALFFAAHGSATDISFTIGYFTPIFLVFIALIKCLTIARRADANAKCVHCLSVMLIAWLLAGLLNAVKKFAPCPHPLTLSLTAMCIVVLIVSVPATIMLGVLGLVELTDERRAQIKRGRTQAAIGLSLCALQILGTSGYCLNRFWPTAHPGSEQTSDGNSSVPIDSDRPRSIIQVSRTTGGSSNLAQFKDWNFVFQPPGRPWSQIDIKRFNQDAIIGYAREKPPLYMAIIAERVDPSLKLSSSALAEGAKFVLRSRMEDVRHVAEYPKAVNGLDGVWIASQARIGQFNASYVHWVCSRKGYAYQLVIWGFREHEAQLHAEAQKLIQGFNVLEQDEGAAGPNIAVIDEFRSELFGFRVELRDTGWAAEATESSDQSGVEFCASRLPNTVSITPVWLMGHRPDLDSVAKACLTRLGISPAGNQLRDAGLVQTGNLSGHDFVYQPSSSKQLYTYRIRVLMVDDFVYSIVMSRPSSVVDGATFDELLQQISFEKPDRSPAVALLSDRQLRSHALFFNELGVQSLEGQQNRESQDYFRLAAELQPNDAILLSNWVEICRRNGCGDAALDILNQRLEKFPEHLELYAVRAALMADQGDTAAAIAQYDSIFTAGWADDGDLKRYVDLLCDSGATDRALTIAAAYNAKNNAPWLTMMLVRILTDKGESDQAVTLLKQHIARDPRDGTFLRDVIDFYYEVKQETSAIQLLEQLIADGMDSALVFYLKGEVEFKTKRYRESLSSMESALQRAPGDESIQKALNVVTATLGKGVSYSIKNQIPMVELPPELSRPSTARLAPEQLREVSAYYVDRVRAVEYEPGTSSRVTTRQSICVQSDHGVSQFSTIRVVFDPLCEEVCVNQLDVFDRAGNLIARGDVGDYFVMDESNGDAASHRKVLNIPVPGLQPGCRIDIVVTTRDCIVPEKFPFQSYVFSAAYPSVRDALYVSAPKTTLLCSGPNAPPPKRASQGLYWVMENVPAMHAEPLQEELTTFLPIVYLGDSQSSWKQVANDYLKLIADRLPVTAEAEQLAQKLTANQPDQIVRMLDLARHVQREYSYKAIEFGRRSLQMSPSSETIRNKYGDCKDHSLLLCHLLQAAGIRARLALANSSSQVRKDIPSLDQFDHMVVFVDAPGGAYCFDTTDKNSDMAMRVPPSLAGKELLVLDSDQPRFVTVANATQDTSQMDIARRVYLEPTGRMRVHETLVFRGYYASGMRAFLKAVDASQRRAAWQSAVGSNAAGVQLVDLDVQNLEETESPLVVTAVVRLQDAWKERGDGLLVASLPLLWESGVLTPEYVQDRSTPWRLVIPFRVNLSVMVEPPVGYTCRAAEHAPLEGSNQFIEWKASSTPVPEGLRISCTAVRVAGHFDANMYETFCDSMRQPRHAFSPTLTFSRAGGAQARSATNQPQNAPAKSRR